MKIRFLPNQIMQWTGGKLFRSNNSTNNTEVFYPGISTDTREIKSGEIFLALQGENYDGHEFAEAAIERGAGMLILEEDSSQAGEWLLKIDKPGTPDLLLVEDTLRAYMDIAAGYRQTLETTIIGITGSVGKTTTRRMVHQILSSQLNVNQSDANLNNQIGLSYTILGTHPSAQVLVAEIGIDRIGEMAELSELARPDIAIVTGVGYSHALHFGSKEVILREKMDLLKDMKESSLVLLNGKDKSLREWALAHRRVKKQAIWFTSDLIHKDDLLEKDFPVFWYEDLKISGEKTEFKARCSFSPEESWQIKLPSAVPHLTEAVLCGLACAYMQGLDMEIAAAATSGFKNTGSRQKIVRLQNDICLLDDSYNSSPEAMSSGLVTLSHLGPVKSRLGVFGDMRELGQYSGEMHLKIADEMISTGFREIFLIGDDMRLVADYLQDNDPTINTLWFDNRDEMEREVVGHKAWRCNYGQSLQLFGLNHISEAIAEKFSGK